MAVRTRADLKAKLLERFPDNTTGLITPQKARDEFNDLIDSAFLSEDGGAGSNIILLQVDSTSGVVLDFASESFRVFNVSAISAPKTWTLANSENAVKIEMFATIDSLDEQQMPSSFIANTSDFDNTTHIWTPTAIGIYEIKATFNGTWWFLTFESYTDVTPPEIEEVLYDNGDPVLYDNGDPVVYA